MTLTVSKKSSGLGTVCVHVCAIFWKGKCANILFVLQRPAVDIDTDEELARVAAWILHKCKNTPGITSEQIVKLFGSASRHLNEKLHLKPENERQEAISRVRDLVDKVIMAINFLFALLRDNVYCLQLLSPSILYDTLLNSPKLSQ